MQHTDTRAVNLVLAHAESGAKALLFARTCVAVTRVRAARLRLKRLAAATVLHEVGAGTESRVANGKAHARLLGVAPGLRATSTCLVLQSAC